MPPKEKTTKRAQLTDLVLEFLEATVHQFLYVWKIYPAYSFTKRVIYDVPVYMNRHPQLCDYIHSMVLGCRQWIQVGELDKLQVVLLSENGSILRRLTIEAAWTATVSSLDQSNEDPLPLVAIADEFRGAIVALSATPITVGFQATTSNNSDTDTPPASFRLLAHTTEDASRPGTVVPDERTPANSWVFADRYWYDRGRESDNDQEEETKASSRAVPRENALIPIKSIHGELFPLRMQLYIEER